MVGSSASAESGVGGSSHKANDSIDDLLKHLDLKGDEDEEFELEEDFEDLQAGARWMAVARVFSPKAFSHAALMRSAWWLAKDVKFRATDKNMLLHSSSASEIGSAPRRRHRACSAAARFYWSPKMVSQRRQRSNLSDYLFGSGFVMCLMLSILQISQSNLGIGWVSSSVLMTLAVIILVTICVFV